MRYERLHPAEYAELEAQITIVEGESTLVDVSNFVAREEARTTLKRIIQRIDELLVGADKGEKKRLRALKRHGLKVKSSLDHANEQLFVTYREKIRLGDYSTTALRAQFRGYVADAPEEWDDPPRYDHLDTFVDGLLQIGDLPRTQRQPDAEMVAYQPTPARIVLDMVERLPLCAEDVLYDLGSGLGRMVLTVALLSESQVKGVEYEPSYVDYARRRARDLNLTRAAFIDADAREVNYGDGTVFFLYTPFKGKILQRVLELLRYQARKRRIRICTYGPGTFDILPQDWFSTADGSEPDLHRVTIFEST